MPQVTEQRLQNKQWSRIIARAWIDESFKHRLLSTPEAVLRENGVELDPGIRVEIHEASEQVCHLVLPPSPAGLLADENLGPMVGLGSSSGTGSCNRCGV
jgi:hypothetical protein